MATTSMPDWFLPPHAEFRFPALWQGRLRRCIEIELQAGARALACARRGGVRSAVRCASSTVLGGTGTGQGERARPMAAMCSPATVRRVPLRSDRARGRSGGRRALSVPGSPLPACIPTIGVEHALGVRPLRSLEQAARLPAAPITRPIPAGGIFEHFPVNAYEAESRRLRPFLRDRSHAAAAYDTNRMIESRDEFPLTLDLRWCSDKLTFGQQLIQPRMACFEPVDRFHVTLQALRPDDRLHEVYVSAAMVRSFDEMVDGASPACRPHWRTFLVRSRHHVGRRNRPGLELPPNGWCATMVSPTTCMAIPKR